MNVQVQGPDGNTYQFPDGTDKAAAIGYFKKKGIGAPAPAATTSPASTSSTASENPEPSFLNVLGREAAAAGNAIVGMPGAIYHAFADEPTQEETTEAGGPQEVAGAKRIGLGIGRLTAQPIITAAKWYKDAAQGNIPNAYEQALSVAPEAMGAGGGGVIAGKLVESVPSAATALKDAELGPNLRAKAIATGKVAGQDAISRIPVAGRLVRRPSIGDYWDAARAKAPGPEPVFSKTRLGPEPQPLGIPLVSKTRLGPEPQPTGKPLLYSNPVGPPIPDAALLKSRSLANAAIPTSAPESVTGEALGRLRVSKSASPQTAAIPTGTPSGPAIETKPVTTPAKVGELLNEGLGGKSLLPNVPLREQMPGKMPAGHSAVESSAIKSYKYDPATREFEFVSPSGAHYVHGDVSPEQMADFEKASSKGKAFNDIKKNSTYVGKIVNGKRIAVKPSKGLASASPGGAAIPTGAPEGPAIDVVALTDAAKKHLTFMDKKALSDLGKQRGIDLTGGRDPGATGAIAGKKTATEMILKGLSPEETAALRQRR